MYLLKKRPRREQWDLLVVETNYKNYSSSMFYASLVSLRYTSRLGRLLSEKKFESIESWPLRWAASTR
jgi:hypothetical protein